MSSLPRILLVDDDPALAEILSEHLAAEGYDVARAKSAAQALDHAVGYGAVLVNDGVTGAPDLCVGLAALGARIMVLGAALPGSHASVPKPLRIGALINRLAELLKGSEGKAASVRFGTWRLDNAARQLVGESGSKVRLTDKEAAILAYLAADGGVVARERLLAEVWGYSSAVTTHTLETHIYRLRRKIEADPANARLVITENGGYRLATSG